MSKTYAIADIHGRFDLLTKAYELLDLVAADIAKEAGLIVHLGDYIDRGPQSRQVIEFLMDEKTVPVAFKRIILKGSREAMMVETIRKRLNPRWWMGNGGDKTLYSYGHPKIRHRYSDVFPYRPDLLPLEHLDFLDNLPLFHADKQRVYVHAAVDQVRSLPEQNEDVILWGIYKDADKGGYRGAHVVHGHHEHDAPLLLRERTNLDVGAWHRGRLAIGVFDDETPGGPIDIIEVLE